ncbi:zingipain-2 [Pieris rapae]|uniref:zingipain-2 n=1 Tax=Pieris rapae TaxID=64459 RepID=UPI000B926BDB|nr:zingipain-2 [Pieris rapae]
MFRFFCLVLIVTEVLTSQYTLLDQDYHDLDQAPQIYKQFLQKYNKESSSTRYEIFKENLRKINEYNEKSSQNSYGINHFTDLTFEEISECYLGFNGNFTSDNVIEYKPSGIQLPTEIDWRNQGYVTEVKHQLQCGSCFAFSAVGSIEGQYAKAHGTTAFSLSNQQAFDCSSAQNCKTGGIPHEVFQNLAGQGGSMREADYPYEGRKNQCRTDKSKIAVTVTGGSQLQVNDEYSLQDALANYGPLSISICVNDEVTKRRGSRIFTPTTSCPHNNHAVLLVGYGKEGESDFWIIKNSWGLNWAEQGYVRLIRGQRALNIGLYAALPTVA